MSDDEWFYGRAVDDPEVRAERCELLGIIGILAAVGLLVGLFLGIGGALGANSVPPELLARFKMRLERAHELPRDRAGAVENR